MRSRVLIRRSNSASVMRDVAKPSWLVDGSDISALVVMGEADARPAVPAVVGPFGVVKLAGDAVGATRRRVQQDIHGRRGRKHDPLTRPDGFFTPASTSSGHASSSDSRTCSPLMITPASRWSGASTSSWSPPAGTRARQRARLLLAKVIDSLTREVPKALPELAKLGRTLNRRPSDILAYFDHPGSSNTPTKANNAPPSTDDWKSHLGPRHLLAQKGKKNGRDTEPNAAPSTNFTNPPMEKDS